MDERPPGPEGQPHYIRLFTRVMIVQIITLSVLWLLQSSFGRS